MWLALHVSISEIIVQPRLCARDPACWCAPPRAPVALVCTGAHTPRAPYRPPVGTYITPGALSEHGVLPGSRAVPAAVARVCLSPLQLLSHSLCHNLSRPPNHHSPPVASRAFIHGCHHVPPRMPITAEGAARTWHWGSTHNSGLACMRRHLSPHRRHASPACPWCCWALINA